MYILINIFLALVLFALNALLGKFQYKFGEGIFRYSQFAFNDLKEGNFSGNFFLKVVNPAIFLAVTAAVAQSRGLVGIVYSLWLLIPCYWLLRFLYMLIKNRLAFVNLKYDGIACVVSHILGEGVFFCIILPLIEAGEPVWIPNTELRDALWFAIIAYVLKVTWDVVSNQLSSEVLYPCEQKRRVIQSRYHKFRARYGGTVGEALSRLSETGLSGQQLHKIDCLTYAIMIYEDYNRPKSVRIIEYIVKALQLKRVMSLGVMQVRTRRIISDRQSIELAIEKIAGAFYMEIENPVAYAITEYNCGEGYFGEVYTIYEEIIRYIQNDTHL